MKATEGVTHVCTWFRRLQFQQWAGFDLALNPLIVNCARYEKNYQSFRYQFLFCKSRFRHWW